MGLDVIVIVGLAGGIWLGMMGIVARVWLRKKELETGAGPPDLAHQVAELRDEISDLRAAQDAQITELFERLEFAERMLTRGRAAASDERTPAPGQ